MLQGLRESLRGPTSIVVIVMAVGAMVFYGVDSLFTGSSGDDVASVNGEDISRLDFQRALSQQKARLKAQFQLEDDAEQLKDENLRAPTIMSLVREKAMLHAAQKGGMGVANDIVTQNIVEAFSNGGTFNKEILDSYIYRYGYTAATFTAAEAEQYIVRQLALGVNNTAFVTPDEVNLLASISGQKRSFYTVKIPKSAVEKDIELSDSEVDGYYEQNSSKFMEPEKASIEYVELQLSEFAKLQQPAEEDVKSEYEQEVADFNPAAEYTIAHILIEDKSASEKIKLVQDSLSAGTDFAELAKQYSDDLGSKDAGGDLGIMFKDGYDDAIQEAVAALSEGAVTEAVETDAGVHFVKLTKKVVPVAPTFEERKASIVSRLQSVMASDAFVEAAESLEELSFGADSLQGAADELGVTVKSTPYFSRRGGPGIAANQAVAIAAFSEDVLLNGQNSGLLELSEDQVVVVRLKDFKEAKVKPLAEVKVLIESRLKNEKIGRMLEDRSLALIARLNAGESPSDLAKELEFEFVEHEAVERTALDVDRTVLREVYRVARPAEPGDTVFQSVPVPSGDLVLVGLKSVQDGSVDSLEKQQVEAMGSQLERQQASSEVAAFQAGIFESAKVAM